MKHVTIIGAGPGNPDLLTKSALDALVDADLVVGASRLLEAVSARAEDALKIPAQRNEQILSIIESNASWTKAVIVTSGDVGMFSATKKLVSLLADYEVEVIPGISSAQYLAAKLGRPWEDWRFVSAHGIECDIASEVTSGNPLCIVVGGKHSVQSLCADLCAAGMQQTQVTIAEKLSYPDEHITQITAEEGARHSFDALSVMLVEYDCPASDAVWPYRQAGIPDERFIRGSVPMTKQEIRAVALAKLGVSATDVVYDIGAGTGSVSIEMSYLAPRGTVYAIEYKDAAVELIRHNIDAFGATNIELIVGSAPEALQGLPTPQAVFIGGSAGKLEETLEAVCKKNPCVRVCIACISLETLSEATRLLQSDGFRRFEVCQLMVNRSQLAAEYTLMKAQNAIYLVSAEGKIQ